MVSWQARFWTIFFTHINLTRFVYTDILCRNTPFQKNLSNIKPPRVLYHWKLQKATCFCPSGTGNGRFLAFGNIFRKIGRHGIWRDTKILSKMKPLDSDAVWKYLFFKIILFRFIKVMFNSLTILLPLKSFFLGGPLEISNVFLSKYYQDVVSTENPRLAPQQIGWTARIPPSKTTKCALVFFCTCRLLGLHHRVTSSLHTGNG